MEEDCITEKEPLPAVRESGGAQCQTFATIAAAVTEQRQTNVLAQDGQILVTEQTHRVAVI